jgi:hypothetical protein
MIKAVLHVALMARGIGISWVAEQKNTLFWHDLARLRLDQARPGTARRSRNQKEINHGFHGFHG